MNVTGVLERNFIRRICGRGLWLILLLAIAALLLAVPSLLWRLAITSTLLPAAVLPIHLEA